MGRMVTKRMADALNAGLPPALLVRIDHPDGVKHYWTGLDQMTYAGEIYEATFILGTVTPVTYSSNVAIQDITFSLSGLPPEAAGQVSADVRNRTGQAWLACIDENGNVVPDPIDVVDAVLDQQTLTVDDGGKATISITAHAGFYTLERGIDEVYSAEDQRQRYPDDSGCDLITELQQQDVIWTPT